MTKREMKEVFNKAFDLLYEMQKEYFNYIEAAEQGEAMDAWDARSKFELYLEELKEL